MTERQINMTIFILVGFCFAASAWIVFIPTGDGEWSWLDYFHAFFTTPVSAYWFWVTYKKVT